MRQLIGVCSIFSSACLAVAGLATPSIARGASGASSSITFTVQNPDTPLNVVVIMLPSGLKFDYRNQFKIKTQSRPNLVQDADYSPDSDNNPGGKYPLGSAYSACKATGAQCLIVEFNAPGLGPNNSLVFTQGVLKGSVPAALKDLSGSPYHLRTTSKRRREHHDEPVHSHQRAGGRRHNGYSELANHEQPAAAARDHERAAVGCSAVYAVLGRKRQPFLQI